MARSEDVLATEDVNAQRVAVRSIAWLGVGVASCGALKLVIQEEVNIAKRTSIMACEEMPRRTIAWHEWRISAERKPPRQPDTVSATQGSANEANVNGAKMLSESVVRRSLHVVARYTVDACSKYGGENCNNSDATPDQSIYEHCGYA